MKDSEDDECASQGNRRQADPLVLLTEIREQIALMKASLPGLVDPAGISCSAKTPYKLLSYREAMLWRMEELSGSAVYHFERNELAAAIVLTRAAAECSAALWYLMEVVEQYNIDGDLNTLDERAMKLLMGFKDSAEMPQAINVLTMFDRANKAVPGLRRNYESLSEYSHPNWSGTALLFSKIDSENLLTVLGKNPRETSGAALFGLQSLQLALALFIHSYNKSSDAFPDLISKCETGISGAEARK